MIPKGHLLAYGVGADKDGASKKNLNNASEPEREHRVVGIVRGSMSSRTAKAFAERLMSARETVKQFRRAKSWLDVYSESMRWPAPEMSSVIQVGKTCLWFAGQKEGAYIYDAYRHLSAPVRQKC